MNESLKHPQSEEPEARQESGESLKSPLTVKDQAELLGMALERGIEEVINPEKLPLIKEVSEKTCLLFQILALNKKAEIIQALKTSEIGFKQTSNKNSEILQKIYDLVIQRKNALIQELGRLLYGVIIDETKNPS